MNKKTIALVIILLVLVGFITYIIYSELKPGKINPVEEIKNYVALYFLSSKIMFPLALPLNPNQNTNSTQENG